MRAGPEASGLLAELWDPRGPHTGRARRWQRALAPAELLFRAGVAARGAALRAGLLPAQRAPIPILSVGGLEAGGTGKTPLCLELVRLAARAGYRPAVLSRGYGARSMGSRRGGATWKVPALAGEGDAARYGDEPPWLAARAAQHGGAGVWVAPARIHAARAAAAAGADLAILDDGFQHRRLRRDGEIVTLGGRHPFANGRLLPRGPLREPPAALRRADVVVLAGVEPEAAGESAGRVRPWLRDGVPILSWRAMPALLPVRGAGPAAGEPVLLVAGIAHPERLLEAVARLGQPVAQHRFFPDHHRFTAGDLRFTAGDLRFTAGDPRHKAADPHVTAAGGNLTPPDDASPQPDMDPAAPVIVTTEKDWPRLRPALPPEARVALLAQTICWNEEGATAGWLEWIRSVVEESRRRPSRAG